MREIETTNPRNTLIGLSQQELIGRYGSANAEFLKGLRGVDYEAGIKLDRGLRDIANYKVNPNFTELNIKQQAGYAAEVASVSHKNAENIINGNAARFIRSEDLAQYGKNHTVVDIVELMDGSVVSSEQMKFVNDYQNLLKKVARGEGGGKNDLSRYMNADKLSLPTEQVENAKAYCRKQATELRKQAEEVEILGKTETATKLKTDAEKFEQLETKLVDSGLTTEDAINYRLKPTWETTKDITQYSHKAGVEGAKFGAAIGGTISLVTNAFAVASGDKEFSDALLSVVGDTAKSAGVGYATAFTGAAFKGAMQQSSRVSIRALSATSLPGLVVSCSIALAGIVKLYTTGEIDESQLLVQVGQSASGMMSSSMFAGIGQLAIPIPILGGVIGGMIGYTLSGMFHQTLGQALEDARLSEEKLYFVQQKVQASIALYNVYNTKMQAIFDHKLKEFSSISENFFKANSNNVDIDEFILSANLFAGKLGGVINYKNMDEFDHFMISEEKLIF